MLLPSENMDSIYYFGAILELIIACYCQGCPEPYDIPQNCHCDADTEELFCLVEDCGDIAHQLYSIVTKLTVFGPLCSKDRQALRGLYRERLTLDGSPCFDLVNCQR